MAEILTVTACSNMGISGAQVFVKQNKDGFEVRQAIAFFGSYQMKESDLEKINYNPFHDEFDDNFVSGKGETKELALEALKADAKSITDSLWR